MCRFIAYRGTPLLLSKLLHDPENSLIHQSHHARERREPLNGDGYGIGWYVPHISPEPALFHSVRPAWNDRNLLSIGSKTEAGCIFAHIRAATYGEVSRPNCHPFSYGSLMMMHNGHIGGFEQMKRSIRRNLSDETYLWIRGATDSEHFFATFLNALEDPNAGSEITLSDAKEAFRKALSIFLELHSKLEDVRPILLNTVITNGDWILATKFISDTNETPNTLYYSSGKRYDCVDGVCSMREADDDKHSVLIVSEKLTDLKSDWTPVPVNSFVYTNGGKDLHTEDILS